MSGRKARRRQRMAEAEAYAKEARYWAKAPKSALSLEGYTNPINRQTRRTLGKGRKKR